MVSAAQAGRSEAEPIAWPMGYGANRRLHPSYVSWLRSVANHVASRWGGAPHYER